MHLSFYQCKVCGKIVAIVKDSGTPTICCGEVMMELFPQIDESLNSEKHVPVIQVSGDLVTVTVGSTIHPSGSDHFIEWILLLTNKGVQQRLIGPNTKPIAQFLILPEEKILGAYDYCNVHKLWRASAINNKSERSKSKENSPDNKSCCF